MTDGKLRKDMEDFGLDVRSSIGKSFSITGLPAVLNPDFEIFSLKAAVLGGLSSPLGPVILGGPPRHPDPSKQVLMISHTSNPVSRDTGPNPPLPWTRRRRAPPKGQQADVVAAMHRALPTQLAPCAWTVVGDEPGTGRTVRGHPCEAPRTAAPGGNNVIRSIENRWHMMAQYPRRRSIWTPIH